MRNQRKCEQQVDEKKNSPASLNDFGQLGEFLKIHPQNH